MSRRVDAPQTTNADTPRVAQLRAAARECVNNPHPGEFNEHCPLVAAIPTGAAYDGHTMTAVQTITGRPLEDTRADYYRAQLRRWAMRDQLTGTPRG